MTSAQGITFEPRPSAALTFLLAFVVLAGAIAPWPTSLPLAVRCCLSMAALAFGAWRVGRFRQSALAAVQWHPEGAWVVIDTVGAPHAAEPRSARVVGEWVCLRLFWHGARASLVLGPDNMDAEVLRILRIRLGSQAPS
jgi:toxin CptA